VKSNIGNTVIETESFIKQAAALWSAAELDDQKDYMSKKTDILTDFDKQLIAGMEEVVAHINGKSDKGRATVVEFADAKAIREGLGMSQAVFSRAYGRVIVLIDAPRTSADDGAPTTARGTDSCRTIAHPTVARAGTQAGST
jgi:DNA-binding transcriptional regulator YiaG